MTDAAVRVPEAGGRGESGPRSWVTPEHGVRLSWAAGGRCAVRRLPPLFRRRGERRHDDVSSLSAAIAALLTALGFEFVNGFHDTANAVATVIYIHAMPASLAVVWSGSFNFLGVLLSSGAVAFGIISLLPVELILQVGSAAGFAMVFALLIAAVIWNLGTWSLGLPVSSSHTLIGSIMVSASPMPWRAARTAPRVSTGGKRQRSARRC